MQAERFFTSMGTSAHILLVEPPPSRADRQRAEVLLDHSQTMLADLERRWTRFSDNSELSFVNSTAGHPVMVSDDTFEVISLAIGSWAMTGGLFDPTVLEALVEAGYDRSFELIADGCLRQGQACGGSAGACDESVGDGGRVSIALEPTLAVAEPTPRPTPGCEGIVLDPGLCTVQVPRGVTLDLGGIGKGHAADLVSDLLLSEGASGVCVDIGGDIRVEGPGPQDGVWVLGIEDTREPECELTVVALERGAIATSARSNRKWPTPNGHAHHLIDPATGMPSRSGLLSVTVVAAEAATAEVLAKAAFVGGLERGMELITNRGAAALFVTDDGSTARTPEFERFEI